VIPLKQGARRPPRHGASSSAPVDPTFFKELFDDALDMIDFLREGVKGTTQSLSQREAAALLSCSASGIVALLADARQAVATSGGGGRDALLSLGSVDRRYQTMVLAWKRLLLGIEVLVVTLWDY
jgi:hypothetical protein